MAVEIAPYREALVEEVIAVFNRETGDEPYVVPLSPEVWTDLIASKPYFSPDGCLVATEKGRAIGFALTSPGVSRGDGSPLPEVRSVDGLFFPSDRLEVGDALLARCMAYFEACGGVKTVCGFASAGGYPYWRGLYCGTEPVCLTRYAHAWVTFMSHGFTHHQQSLNYLGTPSPRAYRDDLEYEERDREIADGWGRETWKGHRPIELSGRKDGTQVGRVGYAELPYLSEFRQKRVAGIYGMGVGEAYRRQGIATSLLNFLHAQCCERGIEEILVGTTVENMAARHSYEKAGMRPIAFRTGTMYRYAEREKVHGG